MHHASRLALSFLVAGAAFAYVPHANELAVAQLEPAGPSAGALALQLLGQLLPFLTAIIGLLLTGLVLVPLRAWLATKAQTSAVAGVAEKVEHLAEGVVADINATMVKELQSALADGVITKEESAHLREVGIDRLKTQLTSKGLAELGGILGIGGAVLEQYLAGILEKKVEEAKAVGVFAADAVVDGPAAVAEINRGL